MNIVEKPGASVALEAGGAGGAISISPFSPGVPVVGFKGMSVDSAVTRQLLLPRKNAFTPRLEGRDWPDSLRRPGSVQSAPHPPHPTPGSLATAGEADRGLLHGWAPRAECSQEVTLDCPGPKGQRRAPVWCCSEAHGQGLGSWVTHTCSTSC